MLRNIDILFATSHKRPLVPSVGGITCNVMYRQSEQPVCETPAKVTSWVTDPFGWFCELL